MNFKPESSIGKFKVITVNKFVNLYKKRNPNTNSDELKKDLIYFKKLKLNGEKCGCGNTIWIVGSAIAGKGCFTCITGETDSKNDYEIK
jgi:hypothetical protein